MFEHSWIRPCGKANNPGFASFLFGLFIAIFIVFPFPACAVDSSSPVVCPLNLTQNLPCICHVLSHQKQQSIQIRCNNTQPDKVWGALGGYSANIDKLAITNCPEKEDTLLKPLLPLKIRSLEIMSCSISQVHPNAFDDLSESLEELVLDWNALTSVPKLSKLRRLQSLNLNYNNIKELPDTTFSGLSELKQLRFKRNQICNLMPNVLSDQRGTMELLDLSLNCFTMVPAQALRNCGELRWLSLAGNKLDGINPMQFMSMPKLVELRLNSNNLKKIDTKGFMNVPALKILFLQNNKLGSLEQGTLQAFPEMQMVDLGGNLFYKIPSFKDMTALREVRLHNNRIRSIDTLTFSANPSLRRILLHNNQIETIARNSFDSLDALESMILTNNSLSGIEKGMLEGMKNLKDLTLRDNAIAELSRDSFASVPELTFLDLSENQLKTLRAGTFGPLKKLNWLTLANNEIATVESRAFEGKVDNVLLDGNQLRCDDQLDWFVSWLVKNKVRTFLPNQPEIKCAEPATSRGKRLKDLMIEKNNVTEDLINSFQSMNLGDATSDPNAAAAAMNLLKFVPGLAGRSQGAQLGSQMLGSVTDAFPGMRSLPGMNFIPSGKTPISRAAGAGTLDSAIDQFSEPLVKFASGATPSSSDLGKMLSSIPDLVVNIPGFGNVDVSKLNPSLVEHVLKGGQIPGIPKQTLDHIVKQYMQRMYVAAAQAQGLTTTEFPPLPPGTDPTKLLRPLSELPPGMVQSVTENKPLPHLSAEQTNVVKEYYMQQLPIADAVGNDAAGHPLLNLTGMLPPKVFQMMKLLPPNYNLSKLPPEMIRQVMHGEMPDMTQLPLDLQQWIKDNFDKLVISMENANGQSIDEIMHKLPIFEQPKMSTFSPYDINKVDSELVVKRQSEENERWWRIFAACTVGLAGAITLGVLSAFFWYLKQSRATRLAMSSDGAGGALPSMVREQSFRPSASSTLK